MAGAFTQRNASALGQRIGRQPTDGELYMAHFFGTGGAGQLINAARSRPQTHAADMFPAAARANRSIFYDRQGHARSVSGVYAELNRRYQVARANVAPSLSPTAVAALPPTPDTDGTTRAFAVASVQPAAPGAESAFRSLFHGGAGRGAVAPIVSELWNSPAHEPVLPVSAPGTGATQQMPSFDLFRDMPPDIANRGRGRG
jgi:hypothetical protein